MKKVQVGGGGHSVKPRVADRLRVTKGGTANAEETLYIERETKLDRATQQASKGDLRLNLYIKEQALRILCEGMLSTRLVHHFVL